MQLTYSDLVHLNPNLKKEPVKKKRAPRVFHDWEAIDKEHGGNSAIYIHLKTGIPKSAIYRAAELGKIRIISYSPKTRSYENE